MTTTPPESLDAISDEFSKTIGQCITQWALVEEELFQKSVGECFNAL